MKESLQLTKNNLLHDPNNFNDNHRFYFEKSQNTLFKPTPAIKQLINICHERNISPKNILDIGCGNGRNSYALASEFGCEISLIDLNPKFMYAASETLKTAGFKVIDEITAPI